MRVGSIIDLTIRPLMNAREVFPIPFVLCYVLCHEKFGPPKNGPPGPYIPGGTNISGVQILRDSSIILVSRGQTLTCEGLDTRDYYYLWIH